MPCRSWSGDAAVTRPGGIGFTAMGRRERVQVGGDDRAGPRPTPATSAGRSPANRRQTAAEVMMGGQGRSVLGGVERWPPRAPRRNDHWVTAAARAQPAFRTPAVSPLPTQQRPYITSRPSSEGQHSAPGRRLRRPASSDTVGATSSGLGMIATGVSGDPRHPATALRYSWPAAGWRITTAVRRARKAVRPAQQLGMTWAISAECGSNPRTDDTTGAREVHRDAWR